MKHQNIDDMKNLFKVTAWRKFSGSLLLLMPITILPLYGQRGVQDGGMREMLDQMFSEINKQEVPTGLLKDYAVEEEVLSLFSGRSVSENNHVSLLRYAGLVNTIKSASVTDNSFLPSETCLYERKKRGNEIQLSILLYEYAQISADALTSGLIEYTDGKVRIASRQPSPYQIDTTFAGCCLDFISDGREVSFMLPDDLIFTNMEIENLAFDYGEGFVALSKNKPIRAFLKEGKNHLLIKVRLKNGKLLNTHTSVWVRKESTLRTKAVEEPSLPSLSLSIAGKPYRGIQTSAKVSIKYAAGRQFLKKPFIFVEGFDPRFLSPETDGTWNYSSFAYEHKILHQLGYDIVYVDWDKSEEYLQANANVLIEVLKYVNAQKSAHQSTEANILMGHSMGGLIARYALKKMEDESIRHNVSTYISYDVPHLGANIPIGIQYGFLGLTKFLKEHDLLTGMIQLLKNVPVSQMIQYGESLIYSNAAQQMLVYALDPSGYANDNEHRIWQQEINDLGFPKGDRGFDFKMLAIANGDYSSTCLPTSGKYLSTSFHAQSDIFFLLGYVGGAFLGLTLNDIIASLLSLLPGKDAIDGVFELFPATYLNQQVTHIKIQYEKKFLWIIPIKDTPFQFDRNFSGRLFFDTFPSSCYPLTDPNIYGGAEVPVVGGYRYDFMVAQQIPFIPVASALASGNGLTDNRQTYLSPPALGSTPFGENYYVQPMGDHAMLTTDAWSWILSRIERTVIGPNIGENGTQYELSQATGKVTWSTTDANIASIDQNGVLSVKGKGLVTLVAVCQGVRYSKQILVGLPRYILSATHEPGGYQIRAACIDPEFKERLPEVNAVITYRWGIKYPGKDIEWVDTYEENLFIGLIDGEPEVTVFMKVLDPLGNAGTTQSVKVASRDIYYARNQKLYISDDGKLYDAENLSYIYKMSSVYIKYLPDLPDEYKKTKWMVTTADVISPISGVRRIRVTPYAAIYDILPQDEFDFIKNGADESQSYTYMLALRNISYSVVQYLPVVFSYKK